MCLWNYGLVIELNQRIKYAIQLLQKKATTFFLLICIYFTMIFLELTFLGFIGTIFILHTLWRFVSLRQNIHKDFWCKEICPMSCTT